MNPIVIKCGGSVVKTLPKSFYQDVVQLQRNGWMPVMVHGGGPVISQYLNLLNIPSHFSNGLRVTTKEVLLIVEMVLSGVINKQMATCLIQAGGNALGISGIDGCLIKSEPLDPEKELGWVGKVLDVNVQLINQLTSQGVIPVISPIGIDEEGEHYNINADTVASAVAQAIHAPLCFVSDVPGISIENKGEKTFLKTVSHRDIQKMIQTGVIHGGMIPKVQGAIESLQLGVPEVVILHGEEPHVLMKYINGNQAGTKIILEGESGNDEYNHSQDGFVDGNIQEVSHHH